MLELYMYWSSQIKLFMIQEPLMYGVFCVFIGVACQWLYERLNFKNVVTKNNKGEVE